MPLCILLRFYRCTAFGLVPTVLGISPFVVSAAVSPKNRDQDVRVLCPKPYMLACRASGGSPRFPGAQTSTRETALAASEAGAAATGALAGRTGQAAQV